MWRDKGELYYIMHDKVHAPTAEPQHYGLVYSIILWGIRTSAWSYACPAVKAAGDCSMATT